MRELVDRYIDRKISRRTFMRSMTGWGFSLPAVASILDSLEPVLASAADAPAAPAAGTTVTGTGGALLVAQLHAAGVRLVFNCNGSGSYPIFDALVDRPDMHVIQVTQEGQMVAMAQGYALASNRTAFTVNSSVGFPNTLNNMFNAWRDRTPLVVGAQRERSRVHGGSTVLEEWDDYLSPSTAFTRWRWDVDHPERIPEITRRAFMIAATPPEGPVALAFPENVLAKDGARATIVDGETFLRKPRVEPAAGLVADAAKLLVEAKSPLLVLGADVTRSGANASVVTLAERLGMPVVQGERLFADFPTAHPLFLGDLDGPLKHPRDVDVVLWLGAPIPGHDPVPDHAKLIHASIDPGAIGKSLPAGVGIVADVKETTDALVAAVDGLMTKTRREAIRAPRIEAMKSYTDKARVIRASMARERWNDRPISWDRVGAELDRLLDPDAIVVPELAEITWLGSAENAALAQITFAPDGRMKIGRTMGSALGWGVGAAIGVKLGQPNRQVVALQGDGGFMFGQAETLWTMARYEVPVVVIVLNNRCYNGPRNKILRQPGRQTETGKDMTCWLGNPDVDFAAVAKGFGVRAETVHEPGDVGPAIQRAIDATRDGKPYLLDVLVARTGLGAESSWYPEYSLAARRERKV